MTSQWTGFRSPLAAGIEMFLAQKQALGLHLRTTESVLRLLDRFLVEQHVETIEAITPEITEAFLMSRPRTVPHSFNQLLGIVTRLFDWLIAREPGWHRYKHIRCANVPEDPCAPAPIRAC